MSPLEQRLAELIATPDAFRSWLESQDVISIVGRSGDCFSCPVAMFLSSTNLSAHVRVSSFAVSLGTATANLPPWLRQFVRMIDECGQSQISRYAAIDLLNYVEGAAS